MSKPKTIKLHLEQSIYDDAKNIDGVRGEKCNNCGGFAFTMGVDGKRIPCKECEETGVKLPTIRELQTQVSDLREDLAFLRQALKETLATHGLQIKSDLGEVTE